MSSTLPDRIAFLSARWERLFLLTYSVDPDLLLPHLPPELELDTIDGKAFVSLVAFDFLQTKVLGIPWPGYRNFPEINLRFYVRYPKDNRRGVVFIKEYVPKRLIAWLAKALYNEPYKMAEMTSSWEEKPDHSILSHQLIINGKANSISVTLNNTPQVSSDDSLDHFFKEHSWGFGKSHRGSLLEYQVWHPIWKTLDIVDQTIQWDFASVYGEKWAFLSHQEPFHQAFALGSEIRVYPKTLL